MLGKVLLKLHHVVKPLVADGLVTVLVATLYNVFLTPEVVVVVLDIIEVEHVSMLRFDLIVHEDWGKPGTIHSRDLARTPEFKLPKNWDGDQLSATNGWHVQELLRRVDHVLGWAVCRLQGWRMLLLGSSFHHQLGIMKL